LPQAGRMPDLFILTLKTNMDDKLRKRVTSCIETVLDIHEVLGNEGFDEEVLNEIQYARERLDEIHFLGVNEEQVKKIEEATSKLLDVLNQLSKNYGFNHSLIRVIH